MTNFWCTAACKGCHNAGSSYASQAYFECVGVAVRASASCD